MESIVQFVITFSILKVALRIFYRGSDNISNFDITAVTLVGIIIFQLAIFFFFALRQLGYYSLFVKVRGVFTLAIPITFFILLRVGLRMHYRDCLLYGFIASLSFYFAEILLRSSGLRELIFKLRLAGW